MSTVKDNQHHANAAACALSDLNNFYAIIALCENGLLYSESDNDAFRIIKICKSASAKRFKEFNKAMNRIKP